MKDDLKKLIRPFRSSIEYLALPWRAKREMYRDRKRGLGADPGPEAVIHAGIEWLKVAQDNSASRDGGVARHYCLLTGWAESYPETTGYIVPTMLEYYRRVQDDDARQRARRMLQWLREIQFDDGGFQGGLICADPKVPVTFNTGQILLGLVAGAVEFEDDIVDSMRRAADWLVHTLDSDGAWRRYPTPFAKPGEKTYETHVAWGLIEANRVDGSRGYGEVAIRNAEWAISKQRDNGWFEDCCLNEPSAPLTHTLGYAIRGLLECWRFSGDDRFLDAAVRSLRSIAQLVDSDGRLVGRFDSSWKPTVPWVCITGSSQLAECYLIASRSQNSDDFFNVGQRLNSFVRRTIRMEGPSEIRGAVKGALPVDGGYGKFEFLNWAAKFTIDANLRELDMLDSTISARA